MPSLDNRVIAQRFRGFLPVVIDVETGGFDSGKDALLEIGAVILSVEADGRVVQRESLSVHVQPFAGANIEAAALAVNGIRVDNPLRMAVPEREALDRIFRPIRRAVSELGCRRAILVGHNAHFDLGFINAAIARTGYKRSPFHPFSVFDTVTLAGAALGQTVLARALEAAGLDYDAEEAHSALYDAERTAELFCQIVNRFSAAFAETKMGNE